MVGLKEKEWRRQVIEGIPNFSFRLVEKNEGCQTTPREGFCSWRKGTLPKFMLFSLCVMKPFACEDEQEEKAT